VRNIEYWRTGQLKEKFIAGLRQVPIRGCIGRFLRKRHRLKVAIVRSWSATGGVRRGRRFVTENLYGAEAAALVHGVFGAVAQSLSPVEDRLGVVFSMLGPMSHNYFHWLNDHLPRVEDFFLWRGVTPWQIRFLELLGVGPELCINVAPARWAFVTGAARQSPKLPCQGVTGAGGLSGLPS
jgi:hypothetical protein